MFVSYFCCVFVGEISVWFAGFGFVYCLDCFVWVVLCLLLVLVVLKWFDNSVVTCGLFVVLRLLLLAVVWCLWFIVFLFVWFAYSVWWLFDWLFGYFGFVWLVLDCVLVMLFTCIVCVFGLIFDIDVYAGLICFRSGWFVFWFVCLIRVFVLLGFVIFNCLFSR